MKDFDLTIGFWLKDIPYVWVPGKTLKDCYRFYLFDLKYENLHLFSTNDHPLPARYYPIIQIHTISPVLGLNPDI